MDIAGLSMSMSSNKLLDRFSTQMLAKNLDNLEQMGANMADMIKTAPSPSLESLVNPAVGSHIDTLV